MVHKQVPHHLTPSLFQHTTTVIFSNGSQHVYMCECENAKWEKTGVERERWRQNKQEKELDRKAESSYSSYFLCTSFVVSMRNRCSQLDTVHQPSLFAISSPSTANCLNAQTQSQGLTINTRTCEGTSMHRCAQANESSTISTIHITPAETWKKENSQMRSLPEWDVNCLS